MVEIQQSLQTMIDRLAAESPRLDAVESESAERA
jgi:hypothetical protein